MKKILLILLFFISSCAGNWSYSGSTGPEHWGELKEDYKFCKIGSNQSPINLNFPAKDSELNFFYNSAEVEKARADHNVKFLFDSQDFMMVRKKKYYIKKMYFNHPSEHQIDSQQQVLELSVMHKSDDEQWAILGIFIKIGKENPEFNKLINLLEDNNKKAVVKFNLAKVINPQDKIFFYDGSLTVPPCTEGVKHFLMKTPIEMSKEQAMKIIKLALDDKANARPLQKFMPERY